MKRKKSKTRKEPEAALLDIKRNKITKKKQKEETRTAAASKLYQSYWLYLRIYKKENKLYLKMKKKHRMLTYLVTNSKKQI